MVLSKEGYTIINLSDLKNKKVACLTLDLEQDYGDLLEEPSYEGLEHIPNLVNFLRQRNIPLTCFVQGSLFKTHPAQIKQLLALDVEFELHSYSHPGPKEMNAQFEIEKSKDAYRRFFGKDPIGYRSPWGVIRGNEYGILASNGFKFDSSVFPSIRPGAFNNLRKPIKPYFLNNTGIVEFPLAVFSDVVRIPIVLSYIKLLGKPYFYLLKTFHLPDLIVFGFHLHDLFKLSSLNEIPLKKFPLIYRKIFKKIYQDKKEGLSLLEEIIRMFQKKGYTFLKLEDVYKSIYTGSKSKPHKSFAFAGTLLRGRGIDPALDQGDAAPPWNPSERSPPACWGA